MKSINPYITFDGHCEAAFNFYKSVFGGDFASIGRFSEMPPDYSVPEKDKNLIMHVSLPMGESILMGSDTSDSFGPPIKIGNNYSISIDTESKEEADRLFTDLSKDGTVIMPMDNTFWGSYFGMLTDQFGINWMVSTDS